MKIRKYALAGTAAVLAAAALGTGVAVAGIQASDGAFTACVNADGAPRFIDVDAGQACAEGETLTSWTSGWRHRGTFQPDATYAVGDVVRVSYNQCPGAIGYGYKYDSYATMVKTAETANGSCPFSNYSQANAGPTGWQTLFPGERPDRDYITDTFRVGANDNETPANSRLGVTTWNYGHTVWLRLANQKMCGVTATAVSDTPVTVTLANSPYSEWVALYPRQLNGQSVRVALDVNIICRYGWTR